LNIIAALVSSGRELDRRRSVRWLTDSDEEGLYRSTSRRE